jgi:hypothetical protein
MAAQGDAMKEEHPSGTVRHQKDDGEWIVAEPHHPLYSVATMFATEYWDSKAEAWKPIYEDAQGA